MLEPGPIAFLEVYFRQQSNCAATTPDARWGFVRRRWHRFQRRFAQLLACSSTEFSQTFFGSDTPDVVAQCPDEYRTRIGTCLFRQSFENTRHSVVLCDRTKNLEDTFVMRSSHLSCCRAKHCLVAHPLDRIGGTAPLQQEFLQGVVCAETRKCPYSTAPRLKDPPFPLEK